MCSHGRRVRPARRQWSAALALLPVAATCLLALGACGTRDENVSEAELAKAIEREIPAGPDRSPEDRRAAAAALARDLTDLAEEAEALAATAPAAAEPATSPADLIARECEQLAAEISILRGRLDSPATGELLTPEERAAVPAELAQREARYADTCD